MKRSRHLALLPALGLALLAGQLAAVPPASAAAPPLPAASTPDVDLGTAASYSVLGGTGVVNTGNATVLAGDLGLSPSGAITGFGLGLGTVQGETHEKDAAAAQAQTDRRTAYDEVDARTGGVPFSGDQIGQTFAAGLHHSAGAFANTGVMTLDAGGDPDAVFVFQVDAAFSPGATSSVVLTGGARADHVFWQVLGAVSIGQGSSYAGTFLVQGAVTLGQDVALKGRALSAGDVTLADNAVTEPGSVPPDPADTLPVDLGDAGPFAVLAGTGVTSTGSTTVDGDVGTSPSGDVTGFAPGSISGTTHVQDAAAAAAQDDRRTAYDEAAARTSTRTFTGDQTGATFGPGVIRTSAAFANTGTVTLDADGDTDAVFLLQVNAAFSPAAGSSIVLVDGARASHVYYQVLGAVTVPVGATYPGTFLAEGSISLGAGVPLSGRLLSAGAITLSGNAISTPDPDTTAPLVTIDGGATRTTDDTTPTVSGTTDERTGRTVTVTIGDQTRTTTVTPGGTWTTTATTLTDGTYPVLAQITDQAGNTGQARQSLRVTTPPVVVRPRYRPDASIRLAGRRPVGVGIYGGTARQQVSQVLRGKVRRTRVLIRIENSGTVGERLRVRGTARHSSLKVVYRLRGQDITRAVTSGTFRTRRLAPGLAVAITMTVTRSAASRPGNRATFRVVTTSTRAPGAKKQDAVALGVRIARR